MNNRLTRLTKKQKRILGIRTKIKELHTLYEFYNRRSDKREEAKIAINECYRLGKLLESLSLVEVVYCD